MAKSPKDIAAILIGHTKPKHPMDAMDDGELPGGTDDDDAGDSDEQLGLLAGDILDAIKNENPDELAEALQTFVGSVHQ